MKEAIQEWLLDRLDGNIAVQNDDEIRLKECIFCGRPRTMKINIEKLRFICHHGDCDQKGKLVKLIMQIESCEFEEATRIYSNLLSGMARGHKTPAQLTDHLHRVRSRRRLGGEETEEAPQFYELPDEFIPCWDGEVFRIPRYLKTRGVSKASLKRWGIGFCEEGPLEGRIVIPIRCNGAQSWVARKIDPEDFGPKYITPDNDASNLILFGYDEIQDDSVIICVEGTFDAIRLWSYGHQAVSYLKDRLSPGQIDLLVRKCPRRLVLMPDGGDRRANARALKDGAALLARFDDVVVAELPAGADPDTSTEAVIARALDRARRVGATASTEFQRQTIRNPWGA